MKVLLVGERGGKGRRDRWTYVAHRHIEDTSNSEIHGDCCSRQVTPTPMLFDPPRTTSWYVRLFAMHVVGAETPACSTYGLSNWHVHPPSFTIKLITPPHSSSFTYRCLVLLSMAHQCLRSPVIPVNLRFGGQTAYASLAGSPARACRGRVPPSPDPRSEAAFPADVARTCRNQHSPQTKSGFTACRMLLYIPLSIIESPPDLRSAYATQAPPLSRGLVVLKHPSSLPYAWPCVSSAPRHGLSASYPADFDIKCQ